MGNQQNNACSACAGEDVVLENVSRELALMRFLQLQQCGERPLMCEAQPNRYTVCRGHAGLPGLAVAGSGLAAALLAPEAGRALPADFCGCPRSTVKNAEIRRLQPAGEEKLSPPAPDEGPWQGLPGTLSGRSQ